MPFALLVSLSLVSGSEQDALAAIERQARNVLQHEPGCQRFDVSIDEANPGHVLLYEVYDDEAALEAHRLTAHFKEWRSNAERFVAEQTNTLARLVLETQREPQIADGARQLAADPR